MSRSKSWCSTTAPSDATAAIVASMARRDERIRLVRGPQLPPGWCGKQHACWVLAQEARHPLLVFIDADVRLAPDALARMARFLDESAADLASGFPRQETVGLLEKLVIPLMHFILLGFLPLERMRRSPDPAFAAGCGQLFITTRDAYDRSGGHSAIRGTLHDGLKLPRAYRLAGLRTDVFDATDLAVCRMYRTAGEVWKGLAKNAGEGLAAPRLILPMTVILLGGQVFPPVVLVVGLAGIPAGGRSWRSGSRRSRWRRPIIPGGPPPSAFASPGSGPSCIRWACSSWWRSSGTPSRATWRAAHRPGRAGSIGPRTPSRRRGGSRQRHEPAGPLLPGDRRRVRST